MNSLYGNIITHVPRAGFTFARSFSNRKEIEEFDWEGCGTDLGVGVYVLVDYNTGEGYETNKAIDEIYLTDEEYACSDYHRTVWQVRKDEIANEIVCSFELIAKMSTTLISNFVPTGQLFTINDMSYWDYGTFGTAQVNFVGAEEDYWLDNKIEALDISFDEE